MTAAPKHGAGSSPDTRPSLLPFNPADLVAMRMRPAAFAAICCVSKQTVSQWIKRGTVTLGPDGMLDPAVATRQVLERTDPARLRARIFKQAASTLAELHTRIQQLEGELAQESMLNEQWKKAGLFQAQDEAHVKLTRLLSALVERIDEAFEAQRAGTLDAWLDELVAVEYYGQDLEEYRQMLLEGDDEG